MYRSKTIATLISLLYVASIPAFAAGVHKWIDEKGVTHYSDMAPNNEVDQVVVIEVSSSYSPASDVEQDYYSITNQWMRIHQERLEREKIKLEKAKQKAALRPVTPQVVYVNEPNEDRYTVSYPFFVHNKFNKRRRHYKPNHDYGDKPSFRRRGFCPDNFQTRRGRGFRSNRITSGLTLSVH